MKNQFNFVLTASVAVLAFALQACDTACVQGSGNESTDNRKVTTFTELDIAGGFNVTLVQDSSNNVIIQADDNILKLIKTHVSGDKLKISTDNKNICNS